MRRRVLLILCCITLTTAVVSLGATTWQLQTKLSTSGGYLQVRNLPIQTTAGSVAYNNFTTSADIRVVVGANTGYRISSLTKTGTTVTVLDNYTAHYATTFNKSGGTVQSLIAGFTAKTYPLTTTVTGPGRVTPANATVPYGGSVNLNAIPTFGGGMITAVTVNGASYPATYPVPGTMPIALTNITGPTEVAASFVTVTANAGVDLLVLRGAPVTLQGTATGGVTTSWSEESGPASVDTSGWTTLTPSFTLPTSGTYVFRLSESVRGQVLASDTVQVTVTDSITGYVRTNCNGCHSASGVYPSPAFRVWSTGRHKAGGVHCITCHTNAAMPTPVNTNTVDSRTYIIKYASAGPVGTNYCMTCHNSSIASEFAEARHAAVITCSSCHVSQHKPTAVDSATFRVYTGSGYTGRIICLDCHGGPNTTHYFSKGAIDGACVACHATTSHNPVATMEAEVGSRHFNGYTSVSSPSYRAAYVTPTTPCTSCHLNSGPVPDPVRDASLSTERADWASSGHGDTRGAAWKSANFKREAGCVRCHTTVGFIAFSSARATGSWGDAWDSSSAVLSCNGCHSDLESGALRGGAPVKPYANDSYLPPQASTSNLCMKCHCGTESGKGIKALAAADPGFTSKPFSGSHSSAAAGIIFRSIGYEFAFRRYSNSWHFKHDRLGQNRFKAYGYQTGSEGPCIACHMTSPNSHSFSPVAKDANGVITAMRSTSCAGCHQGPAYLDPSRMNSRTARFAASLSALQKVLESHGIYYADAPPYFYKSAGNTDPANAFTAWGSADTVGSAFNFNLLKHEGGAYAHNMLYSKRLIYDSIDYLDNGIMDDSVVATINALAGLDDTQRIEAVAYLAPKGVRP